MLLHKAIDLKQFDQLSFVRDPGHAVITENMTLGEGNDRLVIIPSPLTMLVAIQWSSDTSILICGRTSFITLPRLA